MGCIYKYFTSCFHQLYATNNVQMGSMYKYSTSCFHRCMLPIVCYQQCTKGRFILILNFLLPPLCVASNVLRGCIYEYFTSCFHQLYATNNVQMGSMYKYSTSCFHRCMLPIVCYQQSINRVYFQSICEQSKQSYVKH